MLTINALAPADSVLIPVQAEYLPAKGLELLLKTIARVRRQINPCLSISGILLTMVDERTNDAREIIETLTSVYGGKLITSVKSPARCGLRKSPRWEKASMPTTLAGKLRRLMKA